MYNKRLQQNANAVINPFQDYKRPYLKQKSTAHKRHAFLNKP